MKSDSTPPQEQVRTHSSKHGNDAPAQQLVDQEPEFGGSKVITIAFCTMITACALVVALAFGHLRPVKATNPSESRASTHSQHPPKRATKLPS